MTDWTKALQIFVFGFGGVFAVLWLLTIVIQASGYLIQKFAGKKRET
jgi:Na+-transporting methylmalonyl-CoA/oxaloacetate decarboxylase gamma subunit